MGKSKKWIRIKSAVTGLSVRMDIASRRLGEHGRHLRDLNTLTGLQGASIDRLNDALAGWTGEDFAGLAERISALEGRFRVCLRANFDSECAQFDAATPDATDVPEGEHRRTQWPPTFDEWHPEPFNTESPGAKASTAECCTDGTCETCAPLFAWADYRKDFEPNDTITAHKAFTSGWKAARALDRILHDIRTVAVEQAVEAEPEAVSHGWKPKALRERLAQQSTHAPDRETRVMMFDLMEVLDEHRPLGPDGKHGTLHTSTCGCEVPVCAMCDGDVKWGENVCSNCSQGVQVPVESHDVFGQFEVSTPVRDECCDEVCPDCSPEMFAPVPARDECCNGGHGCPDCAPDRDTPVRHIHRARLADTETWEEAVGVAMGVVSTCWEDMSQTGVFDSTTAAQTVDELIALIKKEFTPDPPVCGECGEPATHEHVFTNGAPNLMRCGEHMGVLCCTPLVEDVQTLKSRIEELEKRPPCRCDSCKAMRRYQAEHPDREPAENTQDDLPRELAALLNRYCAENVSGTPDFILAEFLLDSIKAFNAAVVRRADWRGEPFELPSLKPFVSVDGECERCGEAIECVDGVYQMVEHLSEGCTERAVRQMRASWLGLIDDWVKAEGGSGNPVADVLGLLAGFASTGATERATGDRLARIVATVWHVLGGSWVPNPDAIPNDHDCDLTCLIEAAALAQDGDTWHLLGNTAARMLRDLMAEKDA